MIIDSYEFGEIIIEGKVYKSDLIIIEDKIIENWWREEGHLLKEADLFEVLKYKPEVLIIGTGANGLMRVSEDLIKKLKDEKIEYYILKTKEAVKKFNEIDNKRKAGAFHLTC
ncbi:MAG: MTH938/NDUFAF3 family protein [Caldisericia bacterium]|nr:MTH938/NDUFAF3 family protein [Caldisericia bacterium]